MSPCRPALLLNALAFAHGFLAVDEDGVGIVDDAVEDGVGQLVQKIRQADVFDRSGFQDGLDIPETRAGRVAESSLAGSFEPGDRILVAKLEQCHAGAVSLLFDFVKGKNGFDDHLSVRTDLSGPRGETLGVPCGILLMIGRHVVGYGAVLHRPCSLG